MKKLLLFSLLLLFYCSDNYIRTIQNVENNLYTKNFDSAIPEIRNLVLDAPEKDKLLYLMEAGVVLHSKRDYESSNKAFKEAEEISETIQSSITKNTLSFALSDNESNFLGENFEKVMIKVYIALNYLCMNDYENAKRYFKKVEFELKEMNASDEKYKQNLFARYLDAIASEYLNKYNDARVQYKNLSDLAGPNEFLGDRYALARKEGDLLDAKKYSAGMNSLAAYNKGLQPIPYSPELGELIIINQAGKAAVKESRGKLMDDPTLSKALRASVEGSLRSQSVAGVAITGVILTLAFAENPIPIYKDRDVQSAAEAKVLVNNSNVGNTKIMNDYSDTAIKSFNENYNAIMTKNVTSIASKVVVAAMAAITIGQASGSGKKGDDNSAALIKGAIGLVTGLVAGYAISQTIKPDLRCWRTMPSNFQVKRIYLEEGEYDLEIQTASGKSEKTKVRIEKSKPLFMNFRSL